MDTLEPAGNANDEGKEGEDDGGDKNSGDDAREVGVEGVGSHRRENLRQGILGCDRERWVNVRLLGQQV